MKLLLFDIDGTLVRAGGAGRKALNRAVEFLHGKRAVCDEMNLAGRTDKWNFRRALRSATSRSPTAVEVSQLKREYLRRLPYYVRLSLRRGTYVLPPGIKLLLRRLSREPGVLLGLGTGNLEEGARIKLGPSGLGGYFRFGGFGSDGQCRVALLRKAVQRARRHSGREASQIFVIGDTPLDVAAGRRAGYKTVAVGTGFSTWESLVGAKPDHLARDFRGVSKWLKMFGIKSRPRRRPANS